MTEKTVARTFRMTENFSQKIDAICAELGIKQAAALDSLITAYEMQQSKAILPDRQTEIEDYDTHIQALQSAFLHALEITENTEQRVRAEFQRQLESKDSTIIRLQESIKELEARAQTADERATAAEADAQARISESEKSIEDTQDQLSTATEKIIELVEKCETDKRTISDKERIITSLQKELDIAKEAAESVPELTARATAAEQAQKTAEQENNLLKAELEKQKADFENTLYMAQAQAQLEKQQAILAEQQNAAQLATGHANELKKLYEEIKQLNQELSQAKADTKKPKKPKPNAETPV